MDSLDVSISENISVKTKFKKRFEVFQHTKISNFEFYYKKVKFDIYLSELRKIFQMVLVL